MTYSIDLRERIIAFVTGGGSKAEAARRFSVGEATVYRWLNADSLAPKAYERTRYRKLDWGALKRHVQEHPDMLSIERARHFNVAPSSICYALKRMQITRKKSS